VVARQDSNSGAPRSLACEIFTVFIGIIRVLALNRGIEKSEFAEYIANEYAVRDASEKATRQQNAVGICLCNEKL
jgi:hypothetical protein